MRLYYVIYYVDQTLSGKTLDEWQALPDEGVLAVVEVTDRLYGNPKKHASVRHAYTDYYWMDNSGEIDSGSAKQIPDNVFIKRGKYVDDETWMKIYNEQILVDIDYGTLS